jgi:hypothetical protein
MCRRWRVVAAAIVSLAILGEIEAQSAQPARRLKAPAKAAVEEFTRVTSVRELSNGQVIVADDRENKLMLIDFAAGSARSLAKVGDGPGEFRSVSDMMALNGDSTLVTDGRARRWVVYNGTTAMQTLSAATAMSFGGAAPLCGVERSGRVCVLKPRKVRASLPGLPAFGTFADAESLSVLRISLAHPERMDTLLGLEGSFLSVARGTKGGMNYIYYNPLGVEDQVRLDRDGWLAFVAKYPYQVYWKSPDGEVTRGPVLEPPSTVDEAMKLKAIQEYSPGAKRMGYTPPDFEKWPMFLPAFHNNALQLTTQGHLVIQRIAMPGRTTRVYDVVDRTGKRIDQVTIDANQRIVGFGTASVYVVTADSDGLEKLTRHPWP